MTISIFLFLIVPYHLLSSFSILSIYQTSEVFDSLPFEKIKKRKLKCISAGAAIVQQQIDVELMIRLQDILT